MVYLKKEKAGLGKTNQARKFTCLILVILFILNLTKVRNIVNWNECFWILTAALWLKFGVGSTIFVDSNCSIEDFHCLNDSKKANLFKYLYPN